MDRLGNRDEKPTYEELASALRYITYARQLTQQETPKQMLKRVQNKAKEMVDKLSKVEAKQFHDVVPLKPEQMVVFKGGPATKWECYDENGLRCKGEFIP